MRVIFFIGEFNEGGAERVISILANEMIEKGFDIEILKYHNTENLYTLNQKIKIDSVEEHTNTRNNTVKNIKWMRKHFKENADIIISFLAPFNIISILANLGNNIPIIVSDRNDPRFTPSNKLRRVLRNILYRFANAIVVQTKHNKEYFSKYIQKKTTIIQNPIEIGRYKGLALKTKKDSLIVSVGRLEKQKNQTMLIEAFNEIKKKYSNYKLIIYGEGSYRSELESLINRLNLNDSIFLPGNEKDILNKIAKAKMFILPSNYEGMSNALIEAMSIGLPVISTKVSGTEELIDNNVNGLLIEINDKKELINNIYRLIEDESLCNQLEKNSIKIVERLDVNTIINKWILIIKDLIIYQ